MTRNLILRHGDCVEVLKEYADGSIGAVVCDPPYGLEFMKAEEKADWTIQGSFTGGGSARFRNSPPLPSYGASSSENRLCRTCKGSERGRDRVGFHKCRCVVPDFPARKVRPSDIGCKVQASHLGWLREAYRVLTFGGVVKAFSATRTCHRMGAAMSEVGFTDIHLEAWAYGSGFPKSMSIGKMIDKAVGAEVKTDVCWDGWRTSLKPSWEPVLVGAKPYAP